MEVSGVSIDVVCLISKQAANGKEARLLFMIDHQSVTNRSLPYWMFYESTRIMERWTGKSLFGRIDRDQTVPLPVFNAIYCGLEDLPESSFMHLTDPSDGSALQLKVPVYNISFGLNQELLERSPYLRGYATLVCNALETKAQAGTRQAVRSAIENCLQYGLLADLLTTYASEVEEMLYQEFNMNDFGQARFEAGFEEGQIRIAKKMLGRIKEGEGMEDAIGQLRDLDIADETIDEAIRSLASR